jgi:hypothetical protein
MHFAVCPFAVRQPVAVGGICFLTLVFIRSAVATVVCSRTKLFVRIRMHTQACLTDKAPQDKSRPVQLTRHAETPTAVIGHLVPSHTFLFRVRGICLVLTARLPSQTVSMCVLGMRTSSRLPTGPIWPLFIRSVQLSSQLCPGRVVMLVVIDSSSFENITETRPPRGNNVG